MKALRLLFSFFLMTFLSMPSLAQHVSQQTALQRAKEFMGKDKLGTQVRKTHRQTPQMSLACARNEFYVFNDEANSGYVIISAEECCPSVLGYSDAGYFDEQAIPENMRAWLDGYAVQIRAMANSGNTGPAVAGGSNKTPINPLIKSNWGQDEPFNNMCPLESGLHTLAGCIPVAMAQLMNYYRWPTETSTVIPSHRSDLSDIPAGTVFDWDNILDNYYVGTPSNTQKEAVAQLLLACGMASKAYYGLSSTSAYNSDMLYGMINYLSYGDCMQDCWRSDYKSDDWEQLIYDELAANRPVLYRGNRAMDGGGHMFICDGYDGNHYFHFNWGWSGNWNGSFLLTLNEVQATAFGINEAAFVCVQPNNRPNVYPSVPTSSFVGDVSQLTIESSSVSDNLEIDKPAIFSVKVRNQGSDYFGNFYLLVNGIVQTGWAEDIQSGGSIERYCTFTPMRGGETVFVLSADKEGMTVIGEPIKKNIELPDQKIGYLYNVASGKYLCGGNSWGTKASLGVVGMDVAMIGSNNKYALETMIANSSTDHYLGSNYYCDAPFVEWIVNPGNDGMLSLTVDGHSYLGFDGHSTELTTLSNSSDSNARWLFKTREDILNDMKKATSTNPIDVSMLIGGADFGRNDGRLGRWIGGPVRGGLNENMCGEKYNTTFDVYQVLENIPNGTYKLTAQAFYREGDTSENAALRNNDSEHHYAELYANEVSTPVMSIFDEAGNCGTEGTNSIYGYVPNTMSQTSAYFSSNLYSANMLTVIVTDNTLRLGIRKQENVSKDWTIFDSFRLTYYGDGGEVVIPKFNISLTAQPSEGGTVTGGGEYDEGTTVRAEAKAANGYTFVNWTENGTEVSSTAIYSFRASANRTLVANFREAGAMPPVVTIPDGTYYLYNPASGLFLNSGNSYGTQASLAVAGADLQLVASGDGSTIDTQYYYNTSRHYLGWPELYVDQPAAVWQFARVDEEHYLLTPNGSSFLAYNGTNTALTTTTDFTDEKAYWKLLTRQDIIASMSQATPDNPIDISSLIAYPDFNANGGIRNSSSWVDYPTVGGLVENRCGEKFNQTFNMYQRLTGLPIGVYKLRVQGFYREGADANYKIAPALNLRLAGEEHLYAHLYANMEETPLMSIFDEADHAGAVGISTELGYIPNSMDHTSFYFSNGLYWNELDVNVTDGTLTFGIKKDKLVDRDWTIFDSFRLIYYGKGDVEEAYQIIATADPSVGGTVTGSGLYKYGETATLVATPAEHFTFESWTINNLVVSTSPTYSFVVTTSSDIKAHFKPKTGFERRMVVEEGTGTWCGYCPRGIVGLKTMFERHPDTFIGIAVHYGDAMEIASYNTSSLGISSYPSCAINRSGLDDPNANRLEYVHQLMMKEIAMADVEMTAQWADAVSKSLKIHTTSRYAANMTDDYKLTFVITENEVGPYDQSNYYSGSGEGMGGFESMSNPVSILHNHVARYISAFKGIDESLMATPQYGQDYDFSYNLTLPGNIREKSNIELIVLLLNTETGEIANARRLAAADIKAYEVPSVIESVSGHSTSSGIYSLSGQKLHSGQQSTNRLPAGIYIIDGKKVIVR